MSTIPDAVSAAPEVYRALLENNRVRVLDVRMKPGASSPMHSHPDLVSNSLNPGTLRFTIPRGETMAVELRPGEKLGSRLQRTRLRTSARLTPTTSRSN